MRLALLALVFTVTTAAAETPMTATEFETWSTGKTLDYYDGNLYWGSEQHLSGRQTLDADASGTCRSGHWFAQGDLMCFRYEASPGPFCWRFSRDGENVFARFVDDPDGPTYLVMHSDTPLNCPGPDVGV